MTLEEHTAEQLMELLFRYLNSLKLSETTSMTIGTYLGMNKENLITMINSIVDHYERTGKEPTEEELLKMTVMVSCRKKDEPQNYTPAPPQNNITALGLKSVCRVKK